MTTQVSQSFSVVVLALFLTGPFTALRLSLLLALRTLNNPSLHRPSNALLRHHLHQPSVGTPRGASSDGVDSSNGVALAVTPTQSMTLEAARHLVVFVYERKVSHSSSVAIESFCVP